MRKKTEIKDTTNFYFFLHDPEREGADNFRGEWGGVAKCSMLGAEVSMVEQAADSISTVCAQ